LFSLRLLCLCLICSVPDPSLPGTRNRLNFSLRAWTDGVYNLAALVYETINMRLEILTTILRSTLPAPLVRISCMSIVGITSIFV
jgi:hypothetical protein